MADEISGAKRIEKNAAEEQTKAFRNRHGKDYPRSWLFSEKDIKNLLNQPDCVGMWVYAAFDEKNEMNPILVGAKEGGSFSPITELMLISDCPCPTEPDCCP